MKNNLPVTDNEKLFGEDIRIISTTDLKGAITSFNQNFEDISGFTSEELLHKNHNLVRHPDMPPAAFADLWQTLQAGKQWMGVVKNRCENGDYYWVNAHVSPVFENGRVVGYESVRIKPKQEYVERAKKLYERINNGKKPFSFLSQIYGKSRTFLAFFPIAVIMVLITSFLIDPSQLPLMPSLLIAVLVSTGFSFIKNHLIKNDKLFAEQVFNNPIAQWVYTGRLDTTGAYQLAILMQNAMLRTSTSSIANSSQKLSGLSEKANAIVELTNQGIHRQNNDINMVATAMNQMTATVNEVAQNTSNAMSAANDTKLLSTEGAIKVTNAIGTIDSLSGKVNDAQSTINSLSNDSNNIGGILEVITGIAEQTNLLALNAAIEAARAGDQGRGFAVVADEVRTLASRTQQSTQEIQEMVERIQKGAEQAVETMSEVHASATEAVEQVEASAESLAEIVGSVNVINDMNTQIATAAEEQTAVAEEINRNIISISGVSTETEKSANLTLESIHELDIVIKELESTVNRFGDR